MVEIFLWGVIMQQPLTWWQQLRFGYTHAMQVDCVGQAAILSYTTMFSIVPLLILIISFVNYIWGAEQIGKAFEQFLLEHLVAVRAEETAAYFRHFITQADGLSSMGISFLFVSGFLLFHGMEEALDKVWEVKKKRFGLISTLLYIGLFLCLPLMFVFGMWIEYFLGSTWQVVESSILFTPSIITFVIAVPLFTLLYKLIPNHYVPIQAAFFGGVVAAGFFVIFKKLFVWYFSYFTSYTILYGAVSILPIFMLWLYFSWFIILFGAVVSYVRYKR
jgi:membrane protein